MQDISKTTVAYNIGWDAGMYGLRYYDTWPDDFREGYSQAKAKYLRAEDADGFVRKWVQLRVGAYIRDKPFSEDVTPGYLRSILLGACPVTMQEYTFSEMAPTDWSLDRVDNDRGYERKNLVFMSVRANKAKGSYTLEEIEAYSDKKTPIADLSMEETHRLYFTLSKFQYRSFNFDNPEAFRFFNYYYIGFLIVPDAPLNPVAATQVFISASLRMAADDASISVPLMTYFEASKSCGALKFFKRFTKRVAKYQQKHLETSVYFHEWHNRRNVDNFKLWLSMLPPAVRNDVLTYSDHEYSVWQDKILAKNNKMWQKANIPV